MKSASALLPDGVFEKLYRSPRYYSELLLKIKTKDAQIKPLFFNKSQMYLYKKVQQLRRENKPVRIINLKARQLGMSTGISAIVYHHAATRSNITAMVSSHDQDSSEHIYSMYKLFYEKSDELFRPMTRYTNRKEVVFENPDDTLRKKYPGLNSKIAVQTSANTSLGRSFTIQDFHGSEVAYWDNPKEVMEGVEQAVPELPGTMIFIESTANGVGNYFHEKCIRALEGKSNYQLVFIPWFWEPSYQTLGVVQPFTLCSAEREEYGNEAALQRQHNLSWAQLRWRRDKIDNNFEGSVERFQQEYPSSPHEAFIFSGQPLFNVKILTAMRDVCPLPRFSGEIMWSGMTKDVVKFDVIPNDRGRLKIWVDPVLGKHYALGADVSEGVKGGDLSAVVVLDVLSLTQVAEWVGLIAPDELAFIVYYLGQKYGSCLSGVEVNNHGLTTVTKLQELGYWNQYRRTVFDKLKKMRRDSVGWKTTAVTKPYIIDGARKHIRTGEVLINSPELIDEMLTYVLHEDGSMGAMPGKHDDRVIAFAIAQEMARQTYVRHSLERDVGPKPFTFSYFDQMAEDLERAKGRPEIMGSWRGAID